MEYITVGYIANTHGLKGELKIKPETHFIDERFAKGAKLYMEIHHEMMEVNVVAMRPQKGMLLVTFEGFTDINQVEQYKGCRLCIRDDQQAPLDTDEIYYRDLKGMKVIQDTGTTLGEVVEIIETGANVVIRVQGEQMLLIPYVKSFIKEVHLQEKELIVHLLDGML